MSFKGTEEDRIAAEYTNALQARIRATAALCTAALAEAQARASLDKARAAHGLEVQRGITHAEWGKSADVMRLADDLHSAKARDLTAAVDAYTKADGELREVSKRYTSAGREGRQP